MYQVCLSRYLLEYFYDADLSHFASILNLAESLMKRFTFVIQTDLGFVELLPAGTRTN